MSSAPDASAPNSRERETASCTIIAMIGASSAQASAANTLPRSSSERPPKPPSIAPHWIMWPSDGDEARDRGGDGGDEHVAVPDVGELVREDALELAAVEDARMPSVTATAACLGFRPVANAFGVAEGMTKMRGIGRPALRVSRSTIS